MNTDNKEKCDCLNNECGCTPSKETSPKLKGEYCCDGTKTGYKETIKPTQSRGFMIPDIPDHFTIDVNLNITLPEILTQLLERWVK